MKGSTDEERGEVSGETWERGRREPYIDADNDSIRASFKAKSTFKRRLSLFVATY